MRDIVRNAFSRSQLFDGKAVECPTRRFADQESLSAYADQEQSIGLVVTGVADIWCLASDGTRTLLNTVRQGECFGIAYLAGLSRMQTDVRARGVCEIAFISRAAFQTMLTEDPALLERYLTLCNMKLQFLLDRISLLTAQSCRTKLAAFFLLNRDERGFVRWHGGKDDLASRLSVSRAAVYRELNELQNRGWIALSRQGVTITDAAGLERMLFGAAKENHQENNQENNQEEDE